MKQSRNLSAPLLALILATTAAPICADALNPVLDDKFTFKLGVLYNKADADITVSVAPLPPTPVSLDFLGIDDTGVRPWAALRWRFGEKWALNFSYDRYDESGGNISTEPFNFDGVLYPVGASLDTELRADAYVMDVSYAIWKKSNYEAGLGLGLHAFDFKAGIDAFLEVDDVVIIDYEDQSDDLIAPVPNLRLFGTYAFNPKVSVTVNAGWLSLTYEDYDGSFWYFAPTLDYRFGENFGAGIGYKYTDIDLEHDSGGGDFEEYNMEFNGATAYISYSF